MKFFLYSSLSKITEGVKLYYKTTSNILKDPHSINKNYSMATILNNLEFHIK